MLEVRKATMNAAATNRLEQIRAGLPGGSPGPALTKGGGAAGQIGPGPDQAASGQAGQGVAGQSAAGQGAPQPDVPPSTG
jgi:hypothetical protein